MAIQILLALVVVVLSIAAIYVVNEFQNEGINTGCKSCGGNPKHAWKPEGQNPSCKVESAMWSGSGQDER